MANNSRQRLLVDTDAYCKLGVAGLLTEAMCALGVPFEESGGLPAMRYMLRRGGLRRKFGEEASDALAILAETLPIAVQPSPRWLDPLTAVASIDPGEAQLFAAAAEHEMLVLTGDKRGLRGLKNIPGFADALDGRVIVLEALLIELCRQMGEEALRSRIHPVMETDIVVRVCFSNSNSSPIAALLSYYKDFSIQVEPLTLWQPSALGGA